MTTKTIKMSFMFDLEFDTDVTTAKNVREETLAMKEYILEHIERLKYHRNYATKITDVKA